MTYDDLLRVALAAEELGFGACFRSDHCLGAGTDGLAGAPDEVVDTIGRYAEAGAERLYLQTLDLSDLEHLELVAGMVMSQV